MPKEFLQRLKGSSFPLAVRDESDINCAAVLVAADFTEAVLLPPALADGEERVAVILRITPHGRAELNRWKTPRP